MSVISPLGMLRTSAYIAAGLLLAVVALATNGVAAGETGNPDAATTSQQSPSKEKSVPSGSEDSSLLALDKRTVLTCDTEAFGMDFNPFKKTNGTIQLDLKPSASPSDAKSPVVGTWYVKSSNTGHVASIATLLAEICIDGCPITRSPGGRPLLWAPAPKALDDVGETETLTIAALKSKPLSVSISTFRGRDIVALEKGTCKSVAGDG